MDTNIDLHMSNMAPYLTVIDKVLRAGFAAYDTYPKALIIDHDTSLQAHCINRHILGLAHRELDGLPGIRHIEISQQDLWLIEPAGVVIRFKKTNEDGKSSNYPTSQALAFESGEELPGLPAAPVRLTAGYLQDETGSSYLRSQISMPDKSGVIWCAAIVAPEQQEEGKPAWREVTKNFSLAV